MPKAALVLPYVPPQQTLDACPHCGAMVLIRLACREEQTWDHPDTGKPERVKVTVFQVQDPPLTPILGEAHVYDAQTQRCSNVPRKEVERRTEAA